MINAPYFGSIQGGDYFVYPDGRILMSGAHELMDSIRGYEGIYNLIWFSNTGYLDTTQHHRYCNGSINEIFPLQDGRFLLSGVFNTYEGQSVGSIIRVEADGALDTTFSTDIEWGSARDFERLVDGRVIAVGYFRYANEIDTLHVLRLLPNGDRDLTFNNALDVQNAQYASFSPLRALHRLPDGRLLIGGNISSVEGLERSGLVMLDSSGYLLPNELAGEGCGLFQDFQFEAHAVLGIVPAGDGSYYIYGAYHGYDDGTTNDTYQRFISRLYGLNVGVQEATEASPQIQVQPNPSDGRFTLALTLPETLTLSGDLALQIYDAQGRLVERRNLGRQLQQSVALDLSAQPTGLYCAHLSDGMRILTGVRLVVE